MELPEQYTNLIAEENESYEDLLNPEQRHGFRNT